jgi:hypothetical protein
LPSADIVPLPLAAKSSLLDPTIGAELQAIAAAAKAEFGADGKGPGVRPPGMVSDPKPLRLE